MILGKFKEIWLCSPQCYKLPCLWSRHHAQILSTKCCLTKNPHHHQWLTSCGDSLMSRIALCKCLDEARIWCCSQISEGSSDNSWVFDFIRRSTLHTGTPFAILLYLWECCQCTQLTSFILKVTQFSATLFRCDVGNEDWHWFSIQESSTLHIQVALCFLPISVLLF